MTPALVTSAANMLLAALAIWLLLVLLAVAFCRAAAVADRRQAVEGSYPSRTGAEALAGGVARGRRIADGDLGARGKGQGALEEGRTRGQRRVAGV